MLWLTVQQEKVVGGLDWAWLLSLIRIRYSSLRRKVGIFKFQRKKKRLCKEGFGQGRNPRNYCPIWRNGNGLIWEFLPINFLNWWLANFNFQIVCIIGRGAKFLEGKNPKIGWEAQNGIGIIGWALLGPLLLSQERKGSQELTSSRRLFIERLIWGFSKIWGDAPGIPSFASWGSTREGIGPAQGFRQIFKGKTSIQLRLIGPYLKATGKFGVEGWNIGFGKN